MPSAFYNTLVQEIMGCGVGIANRTFDSAWYCKVMYLHSTIQALLVESEINQETLMSRALAESRSEFERINNGMVAATESSIKEMIEKVKVEAGDEEKCMICLEEVEVGFEASQMPCSHVFHDDCIKKWLKQTNESSIKEMIERVKVEAACYVWRNSRSVLKLLKFNVLMSFTVIAWKNGCGELKLIFLRF
ncbi:hypothetical protein Gotri_011930, partial [Gossypium trilobum]|nr:hypothetical protein [Gossypium trilobum]